MSDKTPGVYRKVAAVMAEVSRIEKRGRNDFHKYDYVTESDLTDALRPLMAKNGLVLIPSQGAERDEVQMTVKGKPIAVTRILHTFTFVDADDGSSFALQVWGEGQDNMDKASYKAFTGAMKYALMKTFLVATGDDPEQDAGNKEAERVPNATAAQHDELLAQLALKKHLLDNAQRDGVERVLATGNTIQADRALTFLRGLADPTDNKAEAVLKKAKAQNGGRETPAALVARVLAKEEATGYDAKQLAELRQGALGAEDAPEADDDASWAIYEAALDDVLSQTGLNI